MRIAVVIPWRATESRIPLKNYVDNWYSKNLPEAKILYTDSGHQKFNISASRNIGAKKTMDYDIVIHNDADTIPNIDSLRIGIKKTYETGYFCNPYDQYHMIYLSETKPVIDGSIDIENAQHDFVKGSCSGVIITTPATWEKIYGFDENFIGWGYEDLAIRVAHESIMGHGFTRIPGKAYALAHDISDIDQDLVKVNKKRFDLYVHAKNNKQLMIDLVSGNISPSDLESLRKQAMIAEE